jgi:hypothetical protein
VALPTIMSQTTGSEIIKSFCSIHEAKNNSKWKPVAKEICKKLMLSSDDEFAVMNDCDFKNLCDTNYEDMKTFLKNNPKYGAVSLYDRLAPLIKFGHFCAGIIMFRKEALKTVKFDMYPTNSSCVSVRRSLYDNSWDYGYIDTKIRCERDLAAVK